jgi:hypothetical protein
MDQPLVQVGKAAARRPFMSVTYLLGITLALFARGCSPEPAAALALAKAQSLAAQIETRELPALRAAAAAAADEEWQARGWFSCDAGCLVKRARADAARQKLSEAERQKETIVSEAKREVGLWSTFGVEEIRAEFWAAWAEGTAAAQRMTLMDAFSMALMGAGGRKEETLLSVAVQLILRFVVNLTLGLVIAVGMFLISVLGVIYSYGPSFISALAFYSLLFASAASVLASFFGGVVATLVLGVAAIPKRRRLRVD